MGATLPYDSLAALRRALVEAHPHLERIDEVPRNEPATLERGELGQGDFHATVADHYLVNPVCRASELMAELSARARARNQVPMAAE